MPSVPRALVVERLGGHRVTDLPEGDLTSAVLAPLVHDVEATLLFTKRSSRLRRYSGEVSFPGGHREPRSEPPERTALRELEEEIGVGREAVEIVGRLDDRVAYGGQRVRPFVGVLRDRVAWRPDPREVELVFTTPLGDFLRAGVYEGRALADPAGQPERVVHYFHVAPATVWGFTGRLVAELLEVAVGWRPPAPPRIVDGPRDLTLGL